MIPTGPFPSKEFAVAAFEAKFLEKSGAPYSKRKAYKPKKGKYRYKEVNYARVENGEIMWQYWVDDGVDGKADGWYLDRDRVSEHEADPDMTWVLPYDSDIPRTQLGLDSTMYN